MLTDESSVGLTMGIPHEIEFGQFATIAIDGPTISSSVSSCHFNQV